MFLCMLRGRNARTGVVVLHDDDANETAACLESLEHSDDLDLEVDVVVVGPDLGRAAGLNLGITQSLERGCDFVWLLRADVVVVPSTLPLLHAHLSAVPDCGIVGPRILHADPRETIWFDGGLFDAMTGTASHLNTGRRAHAVAPECIDVDFVSGTSMLVRRSMVEAIGLIPVDYLHFFEIADWCARAERAGWRVMVDQRATVVRRTRSVTA